MTLGIPPNVVMALLLGAFVIHGLQPGPLMITQNPGCSGASSPACISATSCC
jgi:TctA family transporter